MFLLVSPTFTSAVAFLRDTIYVLDAAAGELRARQDSTWAGRLFPGRHPVVLVLPSGTWPHIAGLRFWAASGAAIVAPTVAVPLVRRALDRRWTLTPDRLERRRKQVNPRITPVGESVSLAGGALRLSRIDGVSGEGTLLSYLPDSRFLWPSDHLQTVDRPTLYVADVWRTARRLGIQPRWTSGPHHRLLAWDTVDSLMRPEHR